MNKNPYLSVVIPAYNEQDNISKGAPLKAIDYLKKQKYIWELVFVDDGSLDNTAVLLDGIANRDKRIRVIRNPHQGKAATVTTGVLKARGDIILFTDMDQATPIKEIEKFLPCFRDGYDIVIGSRKAREGAPVVRRVMAYGFVVLRTIILRLPFSDTQTGFKALTREVSRKVFGSLQIFSKQRIIKGAAVKAGFDLEVLYVARKLGFKIKEVPVEWHHQGSIRVNPIKDSIDGLKDMVRIRWYVLKGAYKS